MEFNVRFCNRKPLTVTLVVVCALLLGELLFGMR